MITQAARHAGQWSDRLLVDGLAAYGEPVEGTPFGRYRLIELIGEGGMGKVCAVQMPRHPTLSRTTPTRGRSGPPVRMPRPGTAPLGTASAMPRGEICQVDLDAVRGSVANRQRAAVIVGNDRANAAATRLGYGMVTVVPTLTLNAREQRGYRCSHDVATGAGS